MLQIRICLPSLGTSNRTIGFVSRTFVRFVSPKSDHSRRGLTGLSLNPKNRKRGREMPTNAPLMKSKGSLEQVCRQNVTVLQCAAAHCPLINAPAVLGVLPRAVLAEPWSASALEAKVVAVKNQRTLCDPRMQLSRCSSITRSLCSAPSWLDRAAVCCSALSAARFFRGPRRAAPYRPGWTVLQCAAVCCSALSAARFSAVPGWTVCCLHNP